MRAYIFLAILVCVPVGAAASNIMKIPAVDKDSYPDLIAFGYQGKYADIIWLGRISPILDETAFAYKLNESGGGLAGEIVHGRFTLPRNNLTSNSSFRQTMTRNLESHRFVAQYMYTFYDYAWKLADAFSRRNAEQDRLRPAATAAAALNTRLQQVVAVRPSVGPAPLPARSIPYVKKAVYYTDASLFARRARLQEAIASLAAAVAARDVNAYEKAFTQLDHFTEDARLRDEALSAFELMHTNKFLRAQPLDDVVITIVQPTQIDGAPWLDSEQVKVVNMINLLSNVMSDWRPLTGALMLIADDYTAGQTDGTLSMFAIWQHVLDLAWIVDKIVQVRSDDSTAQLVRDQIDVIISHL